jgi:hypothetical protein
LQALMSADQARKDASSAQSQLALARQQLRQSTAAAAKPLAMSGWEDLIEEAAADLEGLEGRVATAAQRLVELQVRFGLFLPWRFVHVSLTHGHWQDCYMCARLHCAGSLAVAAASSARNCRMHATVFPSAPVGRAVEWL